MKTFLLILLAITIIYILYRVYINYRLKVIYNKIKLNTYYKVIYILGYRRNKWIPVTEIKDTLSHVYRTLNLNKEAVASDILLYYNAKSVFKMVNGIYEEGYLILNSHYKL